MRRFVAGLLVLTALAVVVLLAVQLTSPSPARPDDAATDAQRSAQLLEGDAASLVQPVGGPGALEPGKRSLPADTKITSKPGPVLQITVVDQRGDPAVDVPVSTYVIVSGEKESESYQRFTDGAGQIELNEIPHRACTVSCQCSGFPSSLGIEPEFRVELRGDEERVECSLSTTVDGVISGTLRHVDGSPAAGEFVSLEIEHGSFAARSTMMSTDPGGRFWFGDVPHQPVLLQANTPKQAALVRLESHARDVELVLHPADAVPTKLFVVVDGRGQRIPWFRCRFVEPNRGSMPGRDGKSFSVRTGAPAWVEVWQARGEDQRPLPLGPLLAGPLLTDRMHTLTLPAEMFVSGRVTTSDGKPLKDIRVIAEPLWKPPYQPDQGDRLGMAETDARGRFQIGGIGHAPCRVFAVLTAGFARLLPKEARGGDTDVTFVAVPAPSVRVTVRDPSGAPIRGVNVEVLDARLPPLHWLAMFRDGIPDLGNPADTTNADGVATLTRLDPAVRFKLRVNEYDSKHWTYAQEDWAPQPTSITLLPAAVLSGTIMGIDKADIPSLITAHLPDGTKTWARVERGGFRFARLPRGPVWLQLGNGKTEGPRQEATVPSGVILRLPKQK